MAQAPNSFKPTTPKSFKPTRPASFKPTVAEPEVETSATEPKEERGFSLSRPFGRFTSPEFEANALKGFEPLPFMKGFVERQTNKLTPEYIREAAEAGDEEAIKVQEMVEGSVGGLFSPYGFAGEAAAGIGALRGLRGPLGRIVKRLAGKVDDIPTPAASIADDIIPPVAAQAETPPLAPGTELEIPSAIRPLPEEATFSRLLRDEPTPQVTENLYGITGREVDPSLKGIPTRMHAPGPTQEYFESRLPSIIRERAKGIAPESFGAKPAMPAARPAINPVELPSAQTNIVKAADSTNLTDKGKLAAETGIPEFQAAPIVTQVAEEQAEQVARLSKGPFSGRGLVADETKLVRAGATDINYDLARTDHLTRQRETAWTLKWNQVTKNMNDADIEQLSHVMEGTAQPANATVANAARQAKAITDEIANEAVKHGVRFQNPDGKFIDFTPIDQYWPRIPVSKAHSASFVDELVQNGMTRKRAENLAKWYARHGEQLSSPQHARTGKLFEYRRDREAMSQHFSDMARVVSRAEVLGPGDIAVKSSLINKKLDRFKDVPEVSEIVNRHLRGGISDPHSLDEKVRRIANVTSQAQSFLKLGMYPISNLAMHTQIMANGHFPSYVKTLFQSGGGSKWLSNLSKGGRAIQKQAVEAGAVPDISLGVIDQFSRSGWGKLGYNAWVKDSERAVRVLSSGVGRGTANHLFKKATTGNISKKEMKQLQDLLLESDISNVLKQDRLTEEQLKFASGRFAELTQGLLVPRKLPAWWTDSGALQLPLQFRKFAFQGGKSLKDAIVQNPARNIPLILAATQMFGAGIGLAKETVYGGIESAISDKSFDEIMERRVKNYGSYVRSGEWPIVGGVIQDQELDDVINTVIANVMNSWALGIHADTLRLATAGVGVEPLLGPTIGDVDKILRARSPEQLGRIGLRSVPIAGQALQREFLPTQTQEREDRSPGIRPFGQR